MSSQLLRLNAFRGEPASSGFEWHFTPNHNPPRFHGLGSSHFARRYYGNRFCFLFLWLLRSFSSPGSLLPAHGFSSSSKGCSRVPSWAAIQKNWKLERTGQRN
nr:hypothetical protein [Solanum melongena]WMB97099.1 hypothetical protein [Solanum aethiopicum]